jgi:hypothetical protein
MIGIFARPHWLFHQIWLFRCPTPRSSQIRNHLIRRHLFVVRTPVAHRLLPEGAYTIRKIRGQALRDMKGPPGEGRQKSV